MEIKFKGNYYELLSHTFDCSNYKQDENFVNAVKHISEYMGANYKHSGEISASILNEIGYAVPVPTAPDAPVNGQSTNYF